MPLSTGTSSDINPTNLNDNETVNKKDVIHLVDLSPHNLNHFRRLNQTIFPICYNEKFYKDVFQSNTLVQLAFYDDKRMKNVVMVGAVCCRIDLSIPNCRRLYIMTLGCLPSYRRLGVGSKLLQYVLDYVDSQDNFANIFLHVQTNNQDAIMFYEKFGFEIVNTVKNYYRRIEPPDAYVLEKSLQSKTK